MKTDKLLDIMRFYRISLPREGTGVNKRIVNRDLEHAIGDHFFAEHYPDTGTVEARHMAYRRTMTPMKAYRFDHLNADQQVAIFNNDNEWIAETKYDGWRIVMTHIPGTRLHFWGSNLSTTNFMPVNYTHHLPPVYLEQEDAQCMLDAEALCYDTVVTQDGLPSTNTREAIAAILGSSAEVAMAIQLEATVNIMIFDMLMLADLALNARKIKLARSSVKTIENFSLAPSYRLGKKKELQRIWKEGGEGMVVKHLYRTYDHGGRKRTHAVKVKKSAAGIIGDNIDAFVSGYILTPVHSDNDLVGGLVMSVYMDNNLHEVATITNMPDHIRYAFTNIVEGMPVLAEEAYGLVYEIDGQELSSRNTKLMHAKVVSWTPRKDKTKLDCTMHNANISERF